MTDPETRHALLEAIRADVRARVDHILDRFVERAHVAAPRSEAAGAVSEALSEVSDVLSEGIVAQMREGGRIHPDQDPR